MACCPSELPAVSSDYSPKGDYATYADLNTYVIGPSDAKKAIIIVYDIFGFHPSTFQGADRLAASTNALVFVPDFFKGKALPLSGFPPDTAEKKQLIDAVMKIALPPQHIPNLWNFVDELTEKKGITAWGSFGLCWGGKITALASAKGTKFKASGTAHPGRPDAADAKGIIIPYLSLFSKGDGDPAVVKECSEILKAKEGCEVEHYTDMHHGWMAARANLKDPENVKQFEKGWNQTAAFFNKNL
ncbi:alpha/beta-hydrolase [Rhizodiscina lignyota]|uniref:Alpha/beta-hydrolase n=1 Tax=Rhizodiscina lignyota TaxID=1504668 RepID=A0A9P4IF55_9PEZI|nr:alpha/beta-hydrolase [Rhizodiscina lignyota]